MCAIRRLETNQRGQSALMYKRYWVLASASGMILLAGLAQAQQERQNGVQTDLTQTQTQTLPLPLPVEIIERRDDAEARQRRETEATQREIDDLSAQRGMDSATQDIRDYTFYSLILVAIGTLFLFVTLIFSALTNRAAFNAAKAATGMNRLTEALERPLIGIRMPEDAIAFDGENGFAEEIKFKIVNMGRSPAKITAIHREWYASASGEHPPIANPKDSNRGLLSKGWTRYVSGNSETEGIWSTSDRWSSEIQNPSHIFFHGWVRFEDMTGKKFVAGFSYLVQPNSGSGFAMAWPRKNYHEYNYCREDT